MLGFSRKHMITLLLARSANFAQIIPICGLFWITVDSTQRYFQQWFDHKLKWSPEQYGGIWKVQIPADLIWTPDIVLYNTADGDYQITSQTFAQVFFDGTVVWKPPQIYTSFCEIDIAYFPYDEQKCDLKFGGWTYNGNFMTLRQIPVDDADIIETRFDEKNRMYWYSEKGMDLSYFYRSRVYSSKEWDLVNLTSAKHDIVYTSCCGQSVFEDVTYTLTLRRKALFYTCNLMIPSMLVAILTTFVFYLPSADHKITFAISILLQQTVFYNIMLDLIPPSSIALPLYGKYLLFTIILVSISLFVSVVTLNLHRRTGATHTMPGWMKLIFLKWLPKPLCLKPYGEYETKKRKDSISSTASDIFCEGASDWGRKLNRRPSPYFMSVAQIKEIQGADCDESEKQRQIHAALIKRLIECVNYCAQYFRSLEHEDKISEEWSYVAMVIDRCFLILFTAVNLTGTALIVMAAPSLSDPRTELPAHYPRGPLGAETISGGARYSNYSGWTTAEEANLTRAWRLF